MSRHSAKDDPATDATTWDDFRLVVADALRNKGLVPRAIEQMTAGKIKQTRLYDFINGRQQKMSAGDIRLLEPILGFRDNELLSAVPLPGSVKSAVASQHPRIALDPEGLSGKAVVRGTRLSVEFVLGLMADGWTADDIVENYVNVTQDDLLACLAYARDAVGSEKVYPSAA